MLYTLILHSTVCQLYLDKMEREKYENNKSQNMEKHHSESRDIEYGSRVQSHIFLKKLKGNYQRTNARAFSELKN